MTTYQKFKVQKNNSLDRRNQGCSGSKKLSRKKWQNREKLFTVASFVILLSSVWKPYKITWRKNPVKNCSNVRNAAKNSRKSLIWLYIWVKFMTKSPQLWIQWAKKRLMKPYTVCLLHPQIPQKALAIYLIRVLVNLVLVLDQFLVCEVG